MFIHSLVYICTVICFCLCVFVCVCSCLSACPVCFVSLQSADKDTVPAQLFSACLPASLASAAPGINLPSSSSLTSSSVHSHVHVLSSNLPSLSSPHLLYLTSPLPHLPHYPVTPIISLLCALDTLLLLHTLDTFL